MIDVCGIKFNLSCCCMKKRDHHAKDRQRRLWTQSEHFSPSHLKREKFSKGVPAIQNGGSLGFARRGTEEKLEAGCLHHGSRNNLAMDKFYMA